MSENKKEVDVSSEGVNSKKEKGASKKKRRSISKFFFNPRAWGSYDEVSSATKTTFGLFKRLFSRFSREVRRETYDEAISRLGLTDKQIEARRKTFFYSALVYLLFAFGFFVYFAYLLFNLHLLSAFLTFLLVVLMLLTGYREHFWYMQMKKKKLGCNFKDWLEFAFKRRA